MNADELSPSGAANGQRPAPSEPKLPPQVVAYLDYQERLPDGVLILFTDRAEDRWQMVEDDATIADDIGLATLARPHSTEVSGIGIEHALRFLTDSGFRVAEVFRYNQAAELYDQLNTVISCASALAKQNEAMRKLESDLEAARAELLEAKLRQPAIEGGDRYLLGRIIKPASA